MTCGFLTLVDVGINVQYAVNFLVGDMPSGEEADEKWGECRREHDR